nr:MAG TPA: hypothetical protein [Caudoviricetes sp.]
MYKVHKPVPDFLGKIKLAFTCTHMYHITMRTPQGRTHKEEKTMTNERIEKAIEDGARRWTKEGYDRLYVSPELLGFSYNRYHTGNISCAYWDGERISNAEGGRILDTKVYYDLTTDRVSVKGPTYYHREALLEAAKDFFA